mgnify:CR=1 FL=1
MLISNAVLDEELTRLKIALPSREGNRPEWLKLVEIYDIALAQAGVSEQRFIIACGLVLMEEDWFPSVARIIELARESSPATPVTTFVLPTGAHSQPPPGYKRMIDRLPRDEHGKVDLESWYQDSRALRGLPTGDDRPVPPAGWKGAMRV